MKKPKIRFKGFTDDWEQRKLGDVVDVCSGRDYKHLEEGDIPVYGTGGYMLSVSDALSEKNDAIGIGRKGTIDNPYILRAPFWTVDTLFYCTLKDNHDLDFIFCIYQNINWKSMDESTGVPSLSKAIINKVDISTTSLDEQQQIGNYFRKLDHLITLHQRECEQLKTFKKYMLQNMFPENEEKVPKIRFKGFTDDWEQRKFGDVAEIRRGLTYKPDDVKESGIRVLRSSNINEGYFETYKDDILVDEVAVNIPYVKNGDIIITSANGSSRLVGKHAIIKNIPDNSMVHGGFMLVASTNQPEFLNSSMNSPWYAKFINTYVVGGNGAIGNLSKSDLDNQEITVPSLEEQKEIGQYFSTLDKLVTLHQRKCEQLKKFKKYMLQNMFI